MQRMRTPESSCVREFSTREYVFLSSTVSPSSVPRYKSPLFMQVEFTTTSLSFAILLMSVNLSGTSFMTPCLVDVSQMFPSWSAMMLPMELSMGTSLTW